jgi:hypothetical protein
MKPIGAMSPEDYIAQIPEPRRGDIQKLHELICEIAPDLEPYAQSGGLGYGHFRYCKSGREGDWPAVGLASQKRYISVYLCVPRGGQHIAEANAPRFPKANVGKGCIRFRRLADVDLAVLADVIREGIDAMRTDAETVDARAS